MKNIIFSICFCIAGQLTMLAQNYDPIINTDKIWEYEIWASTSTHMEGINYIILMKFNEEPLIINDQTYYLFYVSELTQWKIRDGDWSKPMEMEWRDGERGYGHILREEGTKLFCLTINHECEFEVENGKIENPQVLENDNLEEVLLYDFSLKTGDSYKIPYHWTRGNPGCELYADVVVENVYTVDEYNVTRVAQAWNCTLWNTKSVVEGVGPTGLGLLPTPIMGQACMKKHALHDNDVVSGDCYFRRLSL